MRKVNSLHMFLVALLALLPMGAVADEEAYRQIAVVGEASAKIVPDQVRFSITIEKNDKDLAMARRTHDVALKRFLDIAAKHDIAPNDMKTERMRVWPRYHHHHKKAGRILEAYHVSTTIEVILREMEKTGVLLRAWTEAGFDQVGQGHYQLDEAKKKKLREELKLQAVANARQKAESMAAVLGEEVGQVLTLRESSASPISPMRRKMHFGNAGTMSYNEAAVNPPAGKHQIQARVHAVFAFKEDEED